MLTYRMARALSEGWARGLLVSIEHPDGTARFWTGIGKRTYDGHTWTGSGQLLNVSAIAHTSEIAVQDVIFSLSGVDATALSQLNDNVRNLVASVWLACFSPEDDSVVDEPYKLIDSQLDYQTYEINDDGTATISVIARAGFYTLDRGVEEAWTHENQKLAFPTDTGLSMISSLVKQDLQWKPTDE